LDLALHFVKRNYENVSMRQILEQRIKLWMGSQKDLINTSKNHI
jgi:hypothetical protein